MPGRRHRLYGIIRREWVVRHVAASIIDRNHKQRKKQQVNRQFIGEDKNNVDSSGGPVRLNSRATESETMTPRPPAGAACICVSVVRPPSYQE